MKKFKLFDVQFLKDDVTFIAQQELETFNAFALSQMSEEARSVLLQKHFQKLSSKFLTKTKSIKNSTFKKFDQNEIKQLINECLKLRKEWMAQDLSVTELEQEIVQFLTSNSTRFYFSSKFAQRLYHFNNGIAASALGYWSFKSTSKLGSLTSVDSLPATVFLNFIPIMYTTGLFFTLWSHITKPLPQVSKPLGFLGKVALSPIWVSEFVITKIVRKVSGNKTLIPLNISGEMVDGCGLTWDKFSFIRKSVKILTENWTLNDYSEIDLKPTFLQRKLKF